MSLYLYECIFVVRQDLPAQDVHKLVDKFVGVVAQGPSKLLKKEYWGVRAMSYTIKKNKKGHYVMLGLNASDEALKELDRNLKINEDVINHRFFRVDSLDETPSKMMSEPSDSSVRDVEA